MGSSTILFALLEHRVRKMSRMEGRGAPMIFAAVFTVRWRVLRSAAQQFPYQTEKIRTNNRQRQKRLAWAKDKKDWTAAEWSKVMFSDESTFWISFGNQGPRVWRKRGEAQNPRCLRSSVKFPQSVMVWGAMSSAGVGPLCFLRSKVNTAVYQDVLEHFMLLTNFMEMQISFSNRTWHLHTVPKLPVPGLRTMVSLFLIGQQTRLTLTP